MNLLLSIGSSDSVDYFGGGLIKPNQSTMFYVVHIRTQQDTNKQHSYIY